MHVLSGSDVRDQARVLTHLAAHLQRMGRPQDTRGAMTRSIGLLRSAQNPEPRRLIMSLYYHASCLAELQDLEGGLQSFTEGCSLRTALTSAEVFPPEVIVDGLNAPQRLLDDLCYRERAAYVDLMNVGGTGADVLKALRDWLELAEELERDEAELDGIKHKIAAMLLITGQVAEAEAMLQDAATSSHVVGAAHPPSESPPASSRSTRGWRQDSLSRTASSSEPPSCSNSGSKLAGVARLPTISPTSRCYSHSPASGCG
jgi:hypothetical protein